MAIKPKPRARAKPTYRQQQAHRASSQRMKGRATTNKFNSESIDSIRQKGFADGRDVFQPDAGIDKKTGKGTMYSAQQYAKVKAFNDRILEKNRKNRMDGMKKGVIIGGAVGGSAVAAGSYWSQKKNNDRNSK
jgi:hypothetical protein